MIAIAESKGASVKAPDDFTMGGQKGSRLAMVVQLLGIRTGASSEPTGASDVGFFLAPSILTCQLPP